MAFLIQSNGCISIPALREEGDQLQKVTYTHFEKFLSPPSARRATTKRMGIRKGAKISIPALREEGDPLPSSKAALQNDFYPRPPRGGRRSRRSAGHHHAYFYPRPPRGGRLDHMDDETEASKISIPALREEGDALNLTRPSGLLQFLSPPSARRATSVLDRDLLRHNDFYPRPPRGGRHLRI